MCFRIALNELSANIWLQSLRFHLFHTIRVGFKVVSNTPEEGFLAKMNGQHPNDRAAFQVTDMVEDLVYLEGIPDGYLDGVGCSKRIEVECLLHTFSL